MIYHIWRISIVYDMNLYANYEDSLYMIPYVTYKYHI
jgi:hypothetical protein